MRDKIGTRIIKGSECEFTVWAPFAKTVDLSISKGDGSEKCRMKRTERGYWNTLVTDAFAGMRYKYIIDGKVERPDPCSGYQPEGVHSYSEVVEHSSFRWDDSNWRGIDISEMIIYELHTGIFTPAGTFEGVAQRLDELADLGINTIELMPVAQFPGSRNWGYDGVYPFAVQNSYGGPEGLKDLVNRCHIKGIAVILDVVYNHLGPEGNYLRDFGPYFTGKYRTPWGEALNFDDRYSDDVRNYFIRNAIHWFENYHIDALRVDAVHAILDMSAKPFLRLLAEETQNYSKKQGRRYQLIAESALNDTKVIRPIESGGFGFDSQWSDDLHHSLHTVLTGEDGGYYCDYGNISHLVRSIREGFVYSGQYSRYRKRSYGNSSVERPGRNFIVFSQNHDQIGNRMLGERLSVLSDLESLKLAAGIVLLTPYVPMLFMGEEYAETSPFLYFTSHSDQELAEAVREGRRSEFAAFGWDKEPPDPQSPDTFKRSVLDWELRYSGANSILLDFYRQLIRERKRITALLYPSKDQMEVFGLEEEKLLFMRRWSRDHDSEVFCVFNFAAESRKFGSAVTGGRWYRILGSADKKWLGAGCSLPDNILPGEENVIRGKSFAVYEQTRP